MVKLQRSTTPSDRSVDPWESDEDVVTGLSDCFTYGLLDRDPDSLLRVFRKVVELDESYQPLESEVLENNDVLFVSKGDG